MENRCYTFQKRPSRGVLKIYSKFTEVHRCRSTISIRYTRHGCSPVNFLYIFRTPFPKKTFGWLLLTFIHLFCDWAYLRISLFIFWYQKLLKMESSTISVSEKLVSVSLIFWFLFMIVYSDSNKLIVIHENMESLIDWLINWFI